MITREEVRQMNLFEKIRFFKITSFLVIFFIPFHSVSAGGGLLLPTDTDNLYVGGSVGISNLKPETNNTVWKVDDDDDTSFKIYVGYEFTKRWSAEFFYTDLGNAHLDGSSSSALPSGNINYKLAGTGLVYKLAVKGRINPIIKLGWADVNNKAENNIRYQQNHSSVFFVGAGLEYGLTDYWKLRSEYEYFDKDIQLFSVGLQWNK